jgi:hypothetical protein
MGLFVRFFALLGWEFALVGKHQSSYRDVTTFTEPGRKERGERTGLGLANKRVQLLIPT